MCIPLLSIAIPSRRTLGGRYSPVFSSNRLCAGLGDDGCRAGRRTATSSTWRLQFLSPFQSFSKPHDLQRTAHGPPHLAARSFRKMNLALEKPERRPEGGFQHVLSSSSFDDLSSLVGRLVALKRERGGLLYERCVFVEAVWELPLISLSRDVDFQLARWMGRTGRRHACEPLARCSVSCSEACCSNPSLR